MQPTHDEDYTAYVTEDLHDRLDRLAATADAPGRIDIAEAQRGGQRILRNRRAAKGIGSVAAAGLAIAAVVAGSNLGSPSRHDSPTASSRPLKQRPTLIQPATFGWLPPGQALAMTSQVAGEGYQISAAGNPVSEMIIFTAYPAGAEPPLGHLHGGIPAKRITAPPVNGHHAYWIEKPGSADYEAILRWEYGPKQWGALEIDGQTGSAPTADTVYRVARTMTFSDTKPLPFPFGVRGIPAGLSLQHASIGSPGAPIAKEGPAVGDMEFAGLGGYVDISAVPDTGQPMKDPRVGPPNTTVDGYRAFHAIGTDRSAKPRKTGIRFGDEILCVLKVRGMDICVQSSPSKLLTSSGGVLGLYHRLEIFGANPAHWGS